VAISGRYFHRHKAAKAVADDEGTFPQLRSRNYGADFFGAELRIVVRSLPTIAHAGQINRRNAKVAGEVRRYIAPPVAMPHRRHELREGRARPALLLLRDLATSTQ
jgi:hypothetical protein